MYTHRDCDDIVAGSQYMRPNGTTSFSCDRFEKNFDALEHRVST